MVVCDERIGKIKEAKKKKKISRRLVVEIFSINISSSSSASYDVVEILFLLLQTVYISSPEEEGGI